MDEPDLDRLDDDEKRLLEPLLQRRGYAGLPGLFLAIMPILVLAKLASGGGDAMATLDAKLVVKIVGFLVLAFFAWRWSVLAAIAMLIWHLYFNSGYLGSPVLMQKISYFVFAVWIAIGIFPALVRRALLAKAAGFGEDDELDQRKADRWLDIYQQRARRTGDLPPDDILEGSGMRADDPFWKQDNSDPPAGFAVNLDTTYNAVRALEEGEAHTLFAEDDFGKHVPLLPTLSTGTAVKFDFANAAVSIDANENLTPYEFLRKQADLLDELLAGGADVPDWIEVDADPSVFDARVTRLYWDAGSEHWDVTFQDDGDGA